MGNEWVFYDLLMGAQAHLFGSVIWIRARLQISVCLVAAAQKTVKIKYCAASCCVICNDNWRKGDCGNRIVGLLVFHKVF